MAGDRAGSAQAGAANPGIGSTISVPRFIILTLSHSLSLGFFLAILDSSIVATSLYAIAVEFREIETINWVPLAYTLSYLSCAVLFARISDVIGRRPAYMAAHVIFIAFSFACARSANLPQLIAFRALQGVGGSGVYSLSMILMPEVAPFKYQKFMIGFIGTCIAVAGVLGPLLGGVITEYKTWRWVFWINGPIGGTSALLFYFSWPPPSQLPPFRKRGWSNVDYLGSFLLVATAVLIVFPFQNSGSRANNWGHADFIAPLVMGVVCLITLLLWQVYIARYRPRMAAAIPMELLCNRVYLATVLNTVLLGFPYLLSVYVFPIRFQIVNGKTPLQAGVLLLPMLGATALGSTIGGVLNGRQNRLAETLGAAAILMLIGCALETTAGYGAAIEAKVLGFEALIGFGFGLSAAASTMVANVESTVKEHATAQGIVAQVRVLGGSIGIAASSAILGTKLDARLRGVVDPGQLAHSARGISDLSPEQQLAVREVYTDALWEDMVVCSALSALALLKSNKPRKMSSSSTAAAKRLAGKTILITGASSGIGRSTAFEFARAQPNDLRLILTARRVEALREIAAEIKESVGEGVKVLPVQLDVSKAEEVRGFVEGLGEEWRGVDVLVNNAKVAQAPNIAEEDISVMFNTNVTGLINMTQAILPIFLARPDGGRGDIINIGSIAGREPYAGGSIYCATKAAVRAFTDSLRKELIASRVRVMEIDPGQVETEFSVVRFYGDKAKADAVYAGCDPLTPDDIAEVVVFVASRRENVVVADTLVFPSHQAGAGVLYRKPT
ncbi:NADP-dependent 3-hydroxy acid dehydrogenase [Echria macrotheca]|uniref:NADP-dependent 3-hydroxy acid dehydrogenase n=1 Tax=Echria macrotheca TaxID=438768 RepID=A0AAJ0BFQ8_9PEZI|nr:NADP-dependent 3-hydroxy acid dehydrogenase [Echria macrotheca]